MLNHKFGIEIEFTGITRNQAAKIINDFLGGRIKKTNDHYDTHKVFAPDGRVWKVISDASIQTQKKSGKATVNADKSYSVELVSPILKYKEDVETLQELIRKLRKSGAFANESCGIHIHLDGEPHSVRSLKNFINIIASKNDLFYEALQIKPDRIRYCKKMDETLVKNISRKNPKTMKEIADVWYEGYYQNRDIHYHDSRYHFLNLHSFFTGNKTIELRGFNSEFHAGKVRSYIVLALALNHQALTQKCASSKKPQIDNPKFAMRTYLNRIGFIGEEFKNCREHLCETLSGNSAWRFRIAA
ncbi:MAG: amidoligase family protein [Oscillospiraceae bacterium]|jgi:hypothetical protein|nr:amidoligase family protein [Oscillospiraceae bacterium]